MAHPSRPIRTVKVDGVRFRVALSPRGDTLYVATRGPDALRAYDVDSGRLLARQPVAYLSERNPPLVVSPDGSLLATSSRDGVAVFSTRTLRPRFVLPGQDDGVTALAFSPDGSRIAAGFTSGTSIVWDVAHQRPERTFRGHSQPVEDVVFASGGRVLDSVSADGQLLSWDVAGPGTFPSAREFPDNPRGTFEALPSPDGRTVAYVEYWSAGGQDKSSKPGSIQFRDLDTGRLTPARQLAWAGPSNLEYTWSPDSREFVFAGGAINVPGRGLVNHNLQMWDPKTGSALYTEAGAGVDAALFTTDGRRMVLVSAVGTVTVVDRTTRRPLGTPIRVGKWIDKPYALSPDDRTLYLSLENGSTQAVDLVTHKVALIAHPSPTYGSALLPRREEGGPVRTGRPLGCHAGRGPVVRPPTLGGAVAHVQREAHRLSDRELEPRRRRDRDPGTRDRRPLGRPHPRTPRHAAGRRRRPDTGRPRAPSRRHVADHTPGGAGADLGPAAPAPPRRRLQPGRTKLHP